MVDVQMMPMKGEEKEGPSLGSTRPINVMEFLG
jgi:hypothetical protein